MRGGTPGGGWSVAGRGSLSPRVVLRGRLASTAHCGSTSQHRPVHFRQLRQVPTRRGQFHRPGRSTRTKSTHGTGAQEQRSRWFDKALARPDQTQIQPPSQADQHRPDPSALEQGAMANRVQKQGSRARAILSASKFQNGQPPFDTIKANPGLLSVPWH